MMYCVISVTLLCRKGN